MRRGRTTVNHSWGDNGFMRRGRGVKVARFPVHEDVTIHDRLLLVMRNCIKKRGGVPAWQIPGVSTTRECQSSWI